VTILCCIAHLRAAPHWEMKLQSEKTEDPDAFLEEVRQERDALAKRIQESQEVIARSQRLLERLDAILGRAPRP
jgi:hypothetical protein